TGPTSIEAKRAVLGDWRVLLRAVVPLAAMPLFLTLALPVYSTPQRVLAWGVFAVATAPALRYFANPVGVPFIELVGLQYTLFFALPVFFESFLHALGNNIVPDSDAVTRALGCALLATVYVLIGYSLMSRLVRSRLAIVQFTPSTLRLFGYGLVLTMSAIALR